MRGRGTCRGRGFGAVVGWGILSLGAVWLVSCSSQAAPAEQPAGQPIGSVEEFEAKVLKSSVPVVIDFYADWCGPCKQMAPHMRKLEPEYAGKIAFYNVNIDKVKDLTRQQNIRGVPTLLLFDKGQPAGAPLVGYRSEKQLREALDGLLQTKTAPAEK